MEEQYTLGSVAPIVQGGESYFDKITKQVALIQQQKDATLKQRLEQEEQNRQFRTEQLQNIYDFDVSGLVAGDIEVLGQLQQKMADALNPDSELHYKDSRQLVQDVSTLNNIYNEMKRWGDTGAKGRQSYQQALLNPDLGNGLEFAGDENSLSQRNQIWEKGAFENVNIEGEPGAWVITGDALDQDGNVLQAGVDFMQNPFRNKADDFWRPEVRQGALLMDGVALDYASRAGVDSTNVTKMAEAVFNSDPKILERVRRERLMEINKERKATNQSELKLEDLTEDQWVTHNLGVDQVKEAYVAEAKKGMDLRPRKPVKSSASGKTKPSTFDGTVYDTQSGVRTIGVSKPFDLVTSGVRGEVTHVGWKDGNLVLVYFDSDDELQEKVVTEGSDTWNSVLAKVGGLEGLSSILGSAQIEQVEQLPQGVNTEQTGETDPVAEQNAREFDDLMEPYEEKGFFERAGDYASSLLKNFGTRMFTPTQKF
jgi:hypothetical protein